LTRTMLPLAVPSPQQVEDRLAAGGDLTVLPRLQEQGEAKPDWETLHQTGEVSGQLLAALEKNRLHSVLSQAELDRTLKELYRAARASLEENGANTLYLALGFLRWYEQGVQDKPRYAPLVLIPVELVRRSAAKGYVVRLRDDEPRFNITLTEMLRQNFDLDTGVADPLPQDEEGLDIAAVLAVVEQVVAQQPGWAVLPCACVGMFSFTQFVMWNDLRSRSDDLAQNKIVRSLMQGRLCWQANDMVIGDRVPEEGALLPLPADASQIYAISAACRGESFVLHGPPGMGKSQTITALIANALAQGKTVLFVAEKMAALQVVEKRLDAIGLGPFCLELHSNKARKKAVLEQLRRATEVTKEQPPEAYARRAEQLSALRKELDAYAAALHRRTPSGLSLYQLVSRYETVRDAEDLPPLPAPFAATATPALLDRQQSLLEQLTAAARAVGHPADHPLEPVGSEVYSQQLKTALPPAISDYAAALERTASAAEQLAEALGEPAPSTFSALRRMAETAAELVLWQQLPRVWAGEDCERRLGDIAVMASQYEKAAALRRDLAARWQEGFFRLPGQQLFLSHSENAGKWLVPRTMGLGRLSRQVAAFAKGTVDRAALGREFQKLAEYQEKKAAGDTLFARRGQELDFLDKGEQTDWAEIARLVELARASALRLRTLTGSDAARIRHGGVPALGGPLAALAAAWEQLLPAKNTLYQLLSVREHEGDGWADSQRRLCATLQDSADTLRDWITWNSAAREAEEG
ncbi:MAG: DUF4011 domain-containing protein, partial [Clostridia bacterium]|nr:DUF4011 domain-containing protein [Clostridia bacterium]